MDQESAGLFEEFDESDRPPDTSGLSNRLTIRLARMQDVDELGRISADREGGDELTQSTAFKRAIEDDGSALGPFILVAETESVIIGFAKARYLSGEDGADLARFAREAP
jgi:hypothetical protein